MDRKYLKAEHFKNNDLSIIMWCPSPRFPQTQIQNFGIVYIRPVWCDRKTSDVFSEWNLRFQIPPARCTSGLCGVSCFVTYSVSILLLSTIASLGRTYPGNETNKGNHTHCENSQLKATSVWWVFLTMLGPNTKHVSVNYKPVTWNELNSSFPI